ncbi:hypothetical protein M501DRAFT_998178 [Patellaria atrata CBS 101060]|uniref:Uncharacterized protein n=1 Tax=Patellaria atrata CBS 101060 TaxID=1346257 RepID=A0A9P4SG88_9PEZI|nr:hypothetical protein M501DRAFT_998178 [Patellaria atrata CBS 101060]
MYARTLDPKVLPDVALPYRVESPGGKYTMARYLDDLISGKKTFGQSTLLYIYIRLSCVISF